MNKAPFFTVIIPTFNSAKTVDLAISSIVKQTFTNFEIVVMDNLSTDNTVKIIESYKDERLYVYSELDLGIYDAMNRGIDNALGKWIYFLGSDDELFDERVLEKVYKSASLCRADIIYGKVLLSSTNKVYLDEFNAENLIFKNISHQAIFMRRVVFDQIGKFDLRYKICADHIHNVQWFFNKNLVHTYIDVIIARFGDQGISSTTDDLDKVRDLPAVVRQSAGYITYFRFYILRPYILILKKKCKKLRSRFARITT